MTATTANTTVLGNFIYSTQLAGLKKPLSRSSLLQHVIQASHCLLVGFTYQGLQAQL